MTSPNQWDAVFGIMSVMTITLAREIKLIFETGGDSLYVYRAPAQQHKVDEIEMDDAMQGLPLVVGGEQGWHSGRAPWTLGSAQRCSVRLRMT